VIDHCSVNCDVKCLPSIQTNSPWHYHLLETTIPSSFFTNQVYDSVQVSAETLVVLTINLNINAEVRKTNIGVVYKFVSD